MRYTWFWFSCSVFSVGQICYLFCKCWGRREDIHLWVFSRMFCVPHWQKLNSSSTPRNKTKWILQAQVPDWVHKLSPGFFPYFCPLERNFSYFFCFVICCLFLKYLKEHEHQEGNLTEKAERQIFIEGEKKPTTKNSQNPKQCYRGWVG